MEDVLHIITDGKIEYVLNLVILSRNKDGADFTKDVELIITLNDDISGATKSSTTANLKNNQTQIPFN